MRLVLDTNIVVAALLWSGPPRSLLDMAVDSNVEFFSSPVLIEELAHTLSYAKFAERIKGFGTNVDELVARYAALVTLVTPTAVPRVVANDPDDDHVIAAAVTAQAVLIVSGDRKHLLPIGSHEGIGIVTAVQALAMLGVARA
ncbi:MAG: putative toxin-antitoxin system toxin component, PIN family [Bacteriovorax sp.]|nr:putative toxin-antitoxin system toxin component, PIN family [Rhizobacter sp.]